MTGAARPTSNVVKPLVILHPRYITPVSSHRCSGSMDKPLRSSPHPSARDPAGPASLKSPTYTTNR
eukprot:12291052-Alexandrium_andersonii.AAC.1